MAQWTSRQKRRCERLQLLSNIIEWLLSITALLKRVALSAVMLQGLKIADTCVQARDICDNHRVSLPAVNSVAQIHDMQLHSILAVPPGCLQPAEILSICSVGSSISLCWLIKLEGDVVPVFIYEAHIQITSSGLRQKAASASSLARP